MGNRWLLIGAILLIGGFFWAVSFVVTPSNGDAEFQKMLEAMRQVKSFRGVYTDSASAAHPSERLWELDCNRSILHKQSQDLPTSADAPLNIKEDQFFVGSDQMFTLASDGAWQKTRYTSQLYSASWYCDNVAQGTVRDLLPDVRAMLRSAMIGKGDKKTVNGVRCQDWKFAMKSSTSGQQGFVCIGLEDHLPYQMTIDDGGRYSYSDYNSPIQFKVPDGVL